MNKHLKDVYIFAEHSNKVVEIIYLCKSLGITALSCDQTIIEALKTSEVNVFQVRNNPWQFKKDIQTISTQCVLLFSDTISPRAQWICRHHSSVIIFTKSITSTSKDYYLALSRHSPKCSWLIDKVQQMLGLKGQIYGSKVPIIACTIRETLKYIFYKVVFKYQVIYAGLPGAFGKKVLVPSEKIRQIYIENGFLDRKVVVTGSILEEIYRDALLRSQNIQNDLDVVFFSQPLNLRGAANWLSEIEVLVDDCERANLNLTILLHPRDDYSYYKNLNPNVTIVKGIRSLDENMEFTLRAKLVVVKSSTTSLLPLVAAIPVAYLNYKNVWPFCEVKHFFSNQMVLSKENSIKSIFKRIRHESDTIRSEQKTVLEGLGFFSSSAKDRIYHQIIELESFLQHSGESL